MKERNYYTKITAGISSDVIYDAGLARGRTTRSSSSSNNNIAIHSHTTHDDEILHDSCINNFLQSLTVLANYLLFHTPGGAMGGLGVRTSPLFENMGLVQLAQISTEMVRVGWGSTGENVGNNSQGK